MTAHRIAITATVFLATLSLAACTWVQPDEGAEEVVELPERRVGDCERIGSVEVTTAARVLGLDRHEDKIKEEQRTLAKNHAVERGGDTIVPVSDSENGKRRFDIYRCEDADMSEENDADEDEEGVTVTPYNGDVD